MKATTRSPIKDKPLRLPGQSVAEERSGLLDALETPMLQALLFVVLAGVEWWRSYTAMKPQPEIFTAVAAATVLYAAYRFWRARPKARALQLAAEGEKVVGQFLERLREDGFHVFHDVVGTGFNIDHVLIGPAGIFTVETKTWSKPKKGNAQIDFDGESIRIGTFEPDRDPVVQARAQAGWLKALLAESTARKAEVRPVIVFPGWFVANSRGSFKDVWVLEPKALPAFLSNEPVRLSQEDVKLMAFHLSRFIRSSEKLRASE